jgi:PAS domain S-box-containing protein
MFVKLDGTPFDTAGLFDSLIENFPDMIHSVDESGSIVYFNRTATQLLGYTESELRLMNIRQLYPPEIIEAVEKGFSEVKQSGEKHVESLFMAKDGTRIPVELRTLVIRDESGRFAQTFTVSRDLRKLKEMQEHLIHTGRLAAIGELAAGVVHDLNNPLTAVILASSIMKKVADSPNTPPQELREQTSLYCETIGESASTMENLTTRLRDFSRGVKEQHSPVDLFDPIHDAIFILAHKVRSNNIQVRCPLIKAKHWVLGDRNQIQQVFLNLFANACDAMAQSNLRELTVDIRADAIDDKPFWHCEVRDTGEGIQQELQEKVFKSFFTTKPRGKGTGLGLSIARSILKEHNGDIRLASERGKGTTFSVLLPSLTKHA